MVPTEQEPPVGLSSDEIEMQRAGIPFTPESDLAAQLRTASGVDGYGVRPEPTIGADDI